MNYYERYCSIDANKKLLLDMLRRRKQDEVKKAKAEARTAELKKELERTPSNLASASLEELVALQEDATLNLHMEEYLETEQVLFTAHPQEPTLDLSNDTPFASSAHTAVSSLGLDIPSPHISTDTSNIVDAIFRHSLVSGATVSQIQSTKACNKTMLNSLFNLMAYSPDEEVAGAALYTLLVALGVDGQPFMLLDAVPTPSADASIHLEAIFSTQDILHALKINGYSQKGQPNSGKQHAVSTAAATPADANKDASLLAASKAAEGEEIRLYAIKLLLHAAIALCSHCRRHPAKVSQALPRDATAELLVCILHLHLDPCALRLQDDILASTSVLIEGMDAVDWERKVPGIAEKLCSLGPSHHARLHLLRSIPVEENIGASSQNDTMDKGKPSVLTVGISRAMELRQRVGCLILEKIIPPIGAFKKDTTKKASSLSSSSKRNGPPPNPADIISSQQWFSKPKVLIQGASLHPGNKSSKNAGKSGPSSPSSSAYCMSDIETLLKLCHMLLWPYLLRLWSFHQDIDPVYGLDRASKESDISSKVLVSAFVSEWTVFLSGIRRNVKGLQPEEQSVRALANQLEMEYKSFAVYDTGTM